MARGEHILADRGYCHASGIHYAAEQNSYVAVRLNPDGIVLQTPAGAPFNLLQKLKPIQRSGQIAVWNALVPFEKRPPVSVRICAYSQEQGCHRAGPQATPTQSQPAGFGAAARNVQLRRVCDSGDSQGSAVAKGADNTAQAQRPGRTAGDQPKGAAQSISDEAEARHWGAWDWPLFRPFRAWDDVVAVFPGRCPGLYCCRLSGGLSRVGQWVWQKMSKAQSV